VPSGIFEAAHLARKSGSLSPPSRYYFVRSEKLRELFRIRKIVEGLRACRSRFTQEVAFDPRWNMGRERVAGSLKSLLRPEEYEPFATLGNAEVARVQHTPWRRGAISRSVELLVELVKKLAVLAHR